MLIFLKRRVAYFFGNLFSVFGDHSNSGENGGEEAELYVPQPNGDLSRLEDFLKIDAGEARKEAGNEDCGESNEPVLRSGIDGGLARFVALDDRHAKKEKQHRNPLRPRELLLQQGDGEESSRQDFQLVGN